MFSNEFKICPIEGTDMPDIDEKNMRELIPRNANIDFKDLIKKKHFSTMPGMPEGNVVALHFFICIDPEKINGTISETDEIVKQYFLNEFGEDNVFSLLVCGNKELKYEAVTYPLKGRILKPGNWLKENKKNAEMRFDILVSKTFSLEYTKISQETKDAAQVNLIKDMKLKHLDEYDSTDYIYDAAGYISQLDIDTSIKKFNKLLQDAIHYFTIGTERVLYIQAQTGDIPISQYMKEVEDYFKRNHPELSQKDIDVLCNKIQSAAFGYYILDDLIKDDRISDIKVLNSKTIRVKCNGIRMTSNLTFLNDADYIRFINSLGIRNGLDLRNIAFHRFTDKVTSDRAILRLNISTPTVNSNGLPCLHIRKIQKHKLTLEDMVRKQCMPREVAEFLKERIKDSSGIICGKGGSGKTVLLNALIEDIGHDRSGNVIQETEELHSETHPELEFLKLTEQYDLEALACNGLLTDLDYFIIGEIKGAEALYFLNAADTGHLSWCTLHSPSALKAHDKLADYVMYKGKYNRDEALQLLTEIKIVVFMKKFKVEEIAEAVGWDDENHRIIFKMLYKR